MPDQHPIYPWQEDPLTRLISEVKELQREIRELKDKTVTQDQFNPIKLIVYALVAIMLSSLMTGMIDRVVHPQPAPVTVQPPATILGGK